MLCEAAHKSFHCATCEASQQYFSRSLFKLLGSETHPPNVKMASAKLINLVTLTQLLPVIVPCRFQFVAH
jgi:hypothetical protein